MHRLYANTMQLRIYRFWYHRQGGGRIWSTGTKPPVDTKGSVYLEHRISGLYNQVYFIKSKTSPFFYKNILDIKNMLLMNL